MMEPTTSPPTLIPIVFDIIGTCFSFDASINALQKTLGEEMRLAGVSARVLVNDWYHSSQRDYISLSVSGAYRPFLELLKANLSRVLVAARVHPLYLPPHTPWDPFSLAPVLATLEWMYPRDSLLPASCLLLGTGKFQLLAATSGSAETAQRLLDQALGVGAGRKWEVVSEEEEKNARPAGEAYEAVWRRTGLEGAERSGWFVTSHAWDHLAAQKAGFKTAWISSGDAAPAEEIWGAPDLIAKDLEAAAREIMRREADCAPTLSRVDE